MYVFQSTSRNKTRVTPVSGDQVFNYNVKVINSFKKSMFSIKLLTIRHRFSTLNELKRCVQQEIEKVKDDLVGYIEPGHGQKGKMRELKTEDLSEMYILHKRKRDILLWCYSNVGDQSGTCSANLQRKRCTVSDNPPPSSKRQAIAKNISEVEEIIKKLQEKHGNAYSVEKLNCWGHMLNVGKHSSYDEPPDFPFFKKRKEKRSDAQQSSVLTDSASTSSLSTSTASVCNSPSKRVGLRTQCIDQLSKWHSLLNTGAIDQAQYDELKEAILGDIKKM